MKIIEKQIIRHEYNNLPYMIRWKILGQYIKVHKFLRSDTDCMHDHPWAFLSIIIKGGYFEITPKKVFDTSTQKIVDHPFDTVCIYYKAPYILYRHAKWIHRLVINESKTTWSIVINFKKIRSWGFHTPYGWIGWRNYKPTGGCDI